MSTNAVTIIASTKVRIASVLTSAYVELAYSNNIAKNSFSGNFKRYGLVAGNTTEVDSVTRYSTIDQEFELILIDSFINTAMSDSAETAKGPILQDLAFDIYRDLLATKAGSPSTVIHVLNFSTSKPETIEDKAVVVRASFTIRYRNQI